MHLISVPAFQDNYIWILVNNHGYCLIIDPGEAIQVLKIIKENKWKPEVIFITHHHNDHIDGVKMLRSYFPDLLVYGPEEARKVGITKVVHGGEIVSLIGCKFFVFSTPGHTLGHLCFFSFPYLFCGDTLFSGGCGRLFEGTPNQMYQSLQKIKQLPDETLICCAHEYTLENMKFAISMFPNDFFIKKYYYKVMNLRAKKQKTLPVTLKNERKINLFLRINDLYHTKNSSKEEDSQYAIKRFAWLRSIRDNF